MDNRSRVLKGAQNRASGVHIKCAWDDCDRDGYDLFKFVEHEHEGVPCDYPGAEHVTYLFCTEDHKQYHRYSHIHYGQLPPGYRRKR
jgi:hypothetical protein